jgi:hypothetical protein
MKMFSFIAQFLAPQAVDASTFLSYDTVGDREDLTDIISNIAPSKTPFYSMIGRGKATNTLHEWQTDTLETPNTANAALEGDDASFALPTATVRLGNYVQISRKTLILSDTQEAIKKAGRSSEVAYQAAKDAVELRRDIESIMLTNQAANAGAEATARKTGSLLAFIKTNVSKGTNGVDPVYTNVPNDVRTDGDLRTFTEAMLKDVIAQCWDEGAEPSIVFVGAALKQAVSAFSGNADRVYNIANTPKGNSNAIVASADVYVSDFGVLKVVPNRFMRTRDALVVDPEYAEVVMLRGFTSIPLARTGSAVKRLLEVEWGLRVKNEKAHGIVADLQP